MTTPTLEEFRDNWKQYGVEVGGQIVWLEDRFMICWGISNEAILLDEGGPQGAPAVLLRIIDGDVHSVNWEEAVATNPLGRLVHRSELTE